MTEFIYLCDIFAPFESHDAEKFDKLDLNAFDRYLERRVRVATDQVYESRRDDKEMMGRLQPGPHLTTNFGITDHLVIRLDPRVNWSDLVDQVELVRRSLSSQISRVPDLEVWLLYSADYKIHFTQLTSHLVRSAEGQSLLLKGLREAELEAMLEDEQVVYHHNRAAIFRLPSGELSDYFLRLGNLQRRRDVLDAIVFWALPNLSDFTHVVAETWSISTLAAFLSAFLARYDRRRTKVEWSYLGAYLPSSTDEQARVSALLREVRAEGGKLLLLISASATGRLRDYFLALLEKLEDSRLGLPRGDTLTLISVRRGHEHGNVVLDATQFLEATGLKGALEESLDSTQHVIEINSETYFPDYRMREVENFSALDDPGPTRKFFETYSGHAIFSVCRSGKTRLPGRHHAFHVDFARLIHHPAFASELRARILEIGAIDHLVHRSDDHSHRFLDLFNQVYLDALGDNAFEVHAVNSFGEVSTRGKISELLTDASNSVVVLDPVFITGGHVRDLAIAVRRNVALQRPVLARLRHLVGLFRPETEVKSKYGRDFYPRMSNHAGFDAQMVCVEEVLLPNWGKDDCPWARERRKHEQLYQDSSLAPAERVYIESRMREIDSGMASGLRGSAVFFRRYPTDTFSFFHGSFFLDSKKVVERNAQWGIKLNDDCVDHADLACAVAAAFQQWREKNKRRRPAFYQVRTLPSIEKIKAEIAADQNGFNEPALRAAIWRCLRLSEIAVDRKDNDLRETLTHIFFGEGENEHRVLGGEASLSFGPELARILGERFDQIDWAYLRKLALYR